MARTVPGRAGEGIRIPDVTRHLAGLPIVAGGAAPGGPLGQWRDVGLARNLAWVCDGMGAALGMTWRGAGLTGALANTMHLRLPVPSKELANVRLQVWATGAGANNAAISIESATVGPSTVTVGNGPFGRYPAPGAPVIINAGPDVVTDPAAGSYVDLEIKTTGNWGSLQSVHVDLVEPGAPTNYPTNNTSLPAGNVDAFVPADTDDYAAGLPLGADTLREHLEQWPEQWDRRKIAIHWAEFDRTGGELPPRRLRSVVRVPAGGRTRITLAVYLPAITHEQVLNVYRDDSFVRGATLMSLVVPATAAPGWHMVTEDVRFDGIDLQMMSTGLDAFAFIMVQNDRTSAAGALPIRDGDGIGYWGQLDGSLDAQFSIVMWVG